MFNNKDSKIIKLRGDIDTSTKPIHIHINSSTDDLWKDFSYWLEAISFLAHEVQKERGWSKKQVEECVAEYLDRALDDVSDDEDRKDNDNNDNIDLKDAQTKALTKTKHKDKKNDNQSTKKTSS